MMMNLSNAAVEDVSSASGRPPRQCPRERQMTPDSVVGMSIEEEGDSSSSSHANEDMQISSSTPFPPSSASSWGQQQQHDLASPSLLNILTVESKKQYEVTPNYLHSSVLMQNLPPPSDSKDQGVSERCRRRTCEWMYDICDYFKLNREVVGIALFYVDRYFTITFEGSDTTSDSQQKVPVTRRQFQLVALTGLYIAVKLHGESRQENPTYRPTTTITTLERSDSTSSDCSSQQQWNRLKFSLSVCASISRNQFTTDEIEECERKVFGTLDWHLNPIIPSGNIIDLLLLHLPTMDGGDDSIALFVYDCAKYLAELSISVPALCLVYKPSIVAYSAILYAMDTLTTTKSSSSSDVCFTKHDRQEYERLVCQVSSQHFNREKENVSSAMKILQKICPNLSELFTPPLLVAPASPVGVCAAVTLS